MSSIAQRLQQIRAALDAMVAKIEAEQKRLASQLAPVLNNYLRIWDEHHKYINVTSNRNNVDIFNAKYELAGRISEQLDKLRFAIRYEEQPVALTAHQSRKDGKGVFRLRSKGQGKSLVAKVEMSDLLEAAGGGFDLMLASPRRESFREQHKSKETDKSQSNATRGL